jgi:hypothetical protein
LTGALMLAWWMLAWGATGASADATRLWPRSGQGSLAARVGYFQDDQIGAVQHTLAPSVHGHYGFSRRWSMSAEGGFVLLQASPDEGPGDSTVAVANPTGIAFFEPFPRHRAHRLRFGLGGSLPLSLISRGAGGRLQRASINTAAGMDGLTRLELWSPSRGSVLGLAQLRGPIDAGFRYAVQLKPTVLLPFVRRVSEDYAYFVLPWLAELSWGGDWGEAGVGGALVLTPQSNVDSMQMSLSPFARGRLDDAWLGLRLTAALDEPLAGDRGAGVWGLFLEAGGDL